jgi:hypothetical protein
MGPHFPYLPKIHLQKAGMSWLRLEVQMGPRFYQERVGWGLDIRYLQQALQFESSGGDTEPRMLGDAETGFFFVSRIGGILIIIFAETRTSADTNFCLFIGELLTPLRCPM